MTHIQWPTYSDPHTVTHIQWPTYSDPHTMTHIQWPAYSDPHTMTHIQWPTYSDAHTIQHGDSWLFYYRWTINMALQTASDLFRVRSSFDSGDLYEVFLKVWATKCHIFSGFSTYAVRGRIYANCFIHITWRHVQTQNMTAIASHAFKLAIRGDNMTQLASNLLWSAALIHFTKILKQKSETEDHIVCTWSSP